MQSFIILGHGEELIGPPLTVPSGCILVLTEECGALGNIPWQLYAVFSNPDYKQFFDDPVSHKAIIEKLLERPITVLKEGDPYPILTYTLLSHDKDFDSLEASGVYSFPTPSFVFNPQKTGRSRYFLNSNFARAFEGAIFPVSVEIGETIDRETALKPLFQTSQEQLFQMQPGVYYNLLCRDVISETQQIVDLIKEAFPEINIARLKDNYDFFRVVKHMLQGLQGPAVQKIQEIVERVYSKRKARPNNVEEDLFSMLNSPVKPNIGTINTIVKANPGLAHMHDRRLKRTPLMVAAGSGHTDVVAYLLDKGALIDDIDIDKETALFYACRGSHDATIDLLLERGASPLVESESGFVLHEVANDDSLVEYLKRFVKNGVEVNVRNDGLETALHIATRSNAKRNVEALLALGAKPNLFDEDGDTALMIAIDNGFYECFKMLLPVSDLVLRNKKGTSPLGLAFVASNEEMVMNILDAGFVTDWKKLAIVARKNDMQRALAFAKRMGAGGGRQKTRRNRRKN